MVWSQNKMGTTNEGMWNSPTHAMSDISALAYRRNVPASELIVPAEVAATDQTFEYTRNKMFQSTFADISWNKLGNGRGRGALLQNRDVLHRNDQELKKQLRIANGLGYSNVLIEAKFQNSSPPRSLEEEETISPSYNDDDLSSPPVGTIVRSSDSTTEKEEDNTTPEKEDEDNSIKENGEWNWQRRTVMPAPNRVILKNVALQSLKRQKQKAKAVEETASSEVATPAIQEPSQNVKVKEDWRAEIKAKEEEARRSQAAEADLLTASPKAKKGWRSEPREPLLGDLKIESNWSMFAPNVTPAIADDKHEHLLLPTPEPGQLTAVESAPKSLLEFTGVVEMQRQKKKKKKNQNVRVMYVPDRLFVEPNVAPPGYLMPTNGVSPMAVRNSEYNPLAGQNHRTFGNLFGQTIKQLGTNNNRSPYKTSNSFSLANDEFPKLK